MPILQEFKLNTEKYTSSLRAYSVGSGTQQLLWTERRKQIINAMW